MSQIQRWTCADGDVSPSLLRSYWWVVISEAITIIVSFSDFAAWLVTILWVAHSKPLEKLSILPKIIIVICFGFSAPPIWPIGIHSGASQSTL